MEGAIRYHVEEVGKPGKIKQRVQTASEKIFLLLQEALSDNPEALAAAGQLDVGMKQDRDRVLRDGLRISRAAAEFFASRRQLAATANALSMVKTLRQRLWPDSRLECRQLDGVGPRQAQALARAGVTTVSRLLAESPRRLEAVLGRHYPYGDQLQSMAATSMPPLVALSLRSLGTRGGGAAAVDVEVRSQAAWAHFVSL